MKKRLLHLLLVILILHSFNVFSQTDTSNRLHHIAIFAPLYLDSAFDATGNYKYNMNFPKFLSPGLEFYEGVQLALDSLKKEGENFQVTLFDTKSNSRSLTQILQGNELENTELIIGNVTASDLRLLANTAYRKKIPFINATLPNDGNIVSNPSLVILNSTMKTHCEGIYKFLQKNYATSSITLFTKKGGMEDRLKNYFVEIEKTTPSVPLKLKFITLNENFDSKQMSKYLDSNIQNICIAASLDENFAKYFCFQVASLGSSYHTTIVGMPTWDNITEFSLAPYNGPEIIYSTPFYSNPENIVVKFIQQYFKTNYYMRASDMVIRGFETTYHFAKLLNNYGNNLIMHISEKKYEVINNFNIEPVYVNKINSSPDYYENKKLYFIKKVGGKVTAVF